MKEYKTLRCILVFNVIILYSHLLSVSFKALLILSTLIYGIICIFNFHVMLSTRNLIIGNFNSVFVTNLLGINVNISHSALIKKSLKCFLSIICFNLYFYYRVSCHLLIKTRVSYLISLLLWESIIKVKRESHMSLRMSNE